jgi:hypothetical protein
MNDHELLELAAKAGSIDILVRDYRGLWVHSRMYGTQIWNPLKDNGAALWLAVKRRMSITHNAPRDQKRYVMVDAATEEFDDEGERPAATRRAIVRAAAASTSQEKEGAKGS